MDTVEVKKYANYSTDRHKKKNNIINKYYRSLQNIIRNYQRKAVLQQA